MLVYNGIIILVKENLWMPIYAFVAYDCVTRFRFYCYGGLGHILLWINYFFYLDSCYGHQLICHFNNGFISIRRTRQVDRSIQFQVFVKYLENNHSIWCAIFVWLIPLSETSDGFAAGIKELPPINLILELQFLL